MEFERNKCGRSPRAAAGQEPEDSGSNLESRCRPRSGKRLRAISMDDIAARAKVGRMTIYRRWCNKAAIIMDAFVARVDPGTLFVPGRSYTESIRLQMRSMAKVFRGKDGTLIRALLARLNSIPGSPLNCVTDGQCRDGKWRSLIFSKESRMAFCALTRTLTQSSTSFTPDLLPLQMGTGPLSDAYVDEISTTQ